MKTTQLESGLKKEGLNEKVRYDLIPHELLERLAKQYTYGATKYGENNWRNATLAEASIFKQAAWRHFMAWANNTDQSEDHAIACITNICNYEWIAKHKEKQDE